jgi:preprotein translocase subunit SecB
MKLKSIYLKELGFIKNPNFIGGNPLSFEFSVDIIDESPKDPQKITTTIAYRTTKHDDDAVYPFNFQILMTGEFELEEKETDVALIEKLKHINCPAVIFPYLREAIASIVCKAGYPPLHVPLLNFVSIFNQKKMAEKNKPQEVKPKNPKKIAKN